MRQVVAEVIVGGAAEEHAKNVIGSYVCRCKLCSGQMSLVRV